MSKDGSKYKYYLHDLSYLIQDKIEYILIEDDNGEDYMNEDHVEGITSTYYYLVSSMKELAKKNGIDESEIALDILDEEDIHNIPFKYRELQKNKN